MSYNMKHFRFVMIVLKSSMFDPQQVLLQDHCPDLLLVAGRGEGMKLHKLVLAAHGRPGRPVGGGDRSAAVTRGISSVMET